MAKYSPSHILSKQKIVSHWFHVICLSIEVDQYNYKASHMDSPFLCFQFAPLNPSSFNNDTMFRNKIHYIDAWLHCINNALNNPQPENNSFCYLVILIEQVVDLVSWNNNINYAFHCIITNLGQQGKAKYKLPGKPKYVINTILLNRSERLFSNSWLTFLQNWKETLVFPTQNTLCWLFEGYSYSINILSSENVSLYIVLYSWNSIFIILRFFSFFIAK